jgi:hypothetical protein
VRAITRTNPFVCVLLLDRHPTEPRSRIDRIIDPFDSRCYPKPANRPAATSDISENTMKGFLKNILAKLHVADRPEAVAVAIQRGIIHF